jgi:hypothetical protein
MLYFSACRIPFFSQTTMFFPLMGLTVTAQIEASGREGEGRLSFAIDIESVKVQLFASVTVTV